MKWWQSHAWCKEGFLKFVEVLKRLKKGRPGNTAIICQELDESFQTVGPHPDLGSLP
jgi:hypothetical protein